MARTLENLKDMGKAVTDALPDITPTVKVELTIPEEAKKIVDETVVKVIDELKVVSEKVDYRWRVTQWLIGIGMVLNAASFVLGKFL